MNYKTISVIFVCSLVSCTLKNTEKEPLDVWKEYSSTFIKKHLNEKVAYVIPEGMDSLKDVPLKILYSVNIDCSTCLIKFSYWNRFGNALKEKYGISIPIVAIVRTERDCSDIESRVFEYWSGLWLYDKTDVFVEENQLYDDRFQAVLVDKDDRIRVIGNPILNEQLTKFYEKSIVMLSQEE